MTKVAFEYFEIRPCIEDCDGDVTSFVEEMEFEAQRKLMGDEDRAYWTLYGRYLDEAGQFLAMAIGDFTEKQHALDVLYAILAPMAKARHELIDAGRNFNLDDPVKRRALLTAIADVGNDLTDVIAQSSDHERL
jgi:hypothetical protein